MFRAKNIERKSIIWFASIRRRQSLPHSMISVISSTMCPSTDSHGWPRSQCSLPQWFSTGSPWSELSRSWQLYALHHDHHGGTGPTLDYYRMGSDGSSDRVLASYTCVRTHFWSSAAEYDTVIMLAHVLADW